MAGHKRKLKEKKEKKQKHSYGNIYTSKLVRRAQVPATTRTRCVLTLPTGICHGGLDETSGTSIIEHDCVPSGPFP